MRRAGERILDLARLLRKADRLILKIQSQHSRSLPAEVYYRYKNLLGAANGARFDARLRQLGYVIVGFASGPRGEDVAVDISVADRLRSPIALRGLSGRRNLIWKARLEDQVMEFSTSLDSWHRLAGRAGVALVREDVVIDVHFEVVN